MKQIVDKLNKIAKKINENVELSDRDLIIDSLDSITKAYGGTPNDSTLIVDKLDDIYNNIGSAPSGNIAITENTAEGVPLDIAQYATATVNVAGGGGEVRKCSITVQNDSANTGNANVLSFNEENGCLINDPLVIPASGSITLNYVVEYNELLHGYTPVNFWESFVNINMESDPPTFTNLVNLTIDGNYNLILTDPTENASGTVRLSFTPAN